MKLAGEVVHLEFEKKLKDDSERALAERDVYRQIAQDEKRWCKRKVDDNRAVAQAAEDQRIQSEEDVARLAHLLAGTRWKLARAEHSAEPSRDDLLPAFFSASDSASGASSQQPCSTAATKQRVQSLA